MNWVAIVSALAAALIALTPWLVSWNRRRLGRVAKSGSVATSDAATLWQASQELITGLRADLAAMRAENAKLIAQRDRLIGALDDKVAPILEAVSATQRQDGETLAVILTMLQSRNAVIDKMSAWLKDHSDDPSPAGHG